MRQTHFFKNIYLQNRRRYCSLNRGCIISRRGLFGEMARVAPAACRQTPEIDRGPSL